MNTTLRSILICISVASVTIAATSKPLKRLTPRRVAELTAPSDAPAPRGYKIEISDIGRGEIPLEALGKATPQVVVEQVREFRYPTEFDAPGAAANGAPVIVPTTPTAFETVNAGWTVRMNARPQGKLVALAGAAEYVSVELLPGGYGAVAGPIYTDQGDVLTPNRLDQPKLQTTTTHFHIFALPGESYEVTFYRGNKSEKHTITVKAD